MLFALASYIYSLQPPENPYRNDPRIQDGQRLFLREGCANCHTPPFYTNNKLTLADGFTLPQNHPLARDVMPVSVGTDPGLALRTRKGTGLYKVPSLKGVWYRGRYHHDGSISSLEEWLAPSRMTRTKGHEFGLKLKLKEKGGTSRLSQKPVRAGIIAPVFSSSTEAMTSISFAPNSMRSGIVASRPSFGFRSVISSISTAGTFRSLNRFW